ncbi:MAG TPA: roadblock/LC7 domain-containing protein [Methanobacteriaceae archaeon]|nr:roadblock/LC7 domain-containing protein [Methanobacteriaceae archaeon]
MSDLEIEEQLEKVLKELNQTKGVEGSIIINSVGDVLKHTLRYSGDIDLFGPMAQIIDSSSQRLLGSAGLGQMEKVLLESKKGKSLFLQFEKVHLIILIEKKANLGMVMRAAHQASPQIIEITRDMVVEEPVAMEVEVPEVEVEETSKEVVAEEKIEAQVVAEEKVDAEVVAESETKITEPISEPTKPISESEIISEPEIVPEPTPEPIIEPVEAKPQAAKMQVENLKEPGLEKPAVTEKLSEVKKPSEITPEEPKKEEPSELIPSIRPPISLPTLPTEVIVPDNAKDRSDLILEIYETLFMAMAIGASKVMGVSPARGLTKKFLPSREYKELLNGVDVKNNAAIDFAALKKNAEKIPINNREEIFLRDFSQIIKVITDNYGKVMGYDAFRGMVRSEFQAINNSFGEAMDQLGIKEKMHPELQKLL